MLSIKSYDTLNEVKSFLSYSDSKQSYVITYIQLCELLLGDKTIHFEKYNRILLIELFC